MARPDGGIGRRVGLKIRFLQGSVGSTPSPGTRFFKKYYACHMNKYYTASIERSSSLINLRCGICSIVVACLIAIASNVRIPFFPVPFTLQTLAVVLCSSFFRRQVALIGLGLFTAFSWSFNPLTCGYVLSFCLIPFIVEKLRDCSAVSYLLRRLFLAHFAVLIIGSLWLSYCIGIRGGFVNGCLFFIPAEMLKIAIEYVILSRFMR